MEDLAGKNCVGRIKYKIYINIICFIYLSVRKGNTSLLRHHCRRRRREEKRERDCSVQYTWQYLMSPLQLDLSRICSCWLSSNIHYILTVTMTLHTLSWPDREVHLHLQQTLCDMFLQLGCDYMRIRFELRFLNKNLWSTFLSNKHNIWFQINVY